MKLAKEIRFDTPSLNLSVHPQYDSSKINIGRLIRHNTSGDTPWLGPQEVLVARAAESVSAGWSQFPNIIKYNANEYWIFSGQQSFGATTQRINFWRYLYTEHEFIYQGHVAFNGPGGTITMRGVAPDYRTYTVGTVSGSGTPLTGSGTAWTDSGICQGSRIGFGSIDPAQITTWHEISAVNNNTSITLVDPPVASLPGGTPYVIEDLRVFTLQSNATTANGGLYCLKGLRPELFQAYAATTQGIIVMATTADNLRANYWLADAATSTHTSGIGLALDNFTSWTNQRLYALDPGSSATPSLFAYNGRAPLTGLSSGKSTSAFLFKTGATPATVGTLNASVATARVVTAQHGTGKGVNCYYFNTTTRVHRVELSNTNIFSGATNWITDGLLEAPPGGVGTYLANQVMASLDYDNLIDRFFLYNTGAAIRTYVTRYSQEPFDHVFLGSDYQLDGINSDSAGAIHPAQIPSQGASMDGITFITRNTQIGSTSQQYIYPTGAHWRFAEQTGNSVITNKISISDATKLYRVYIANAEILGNSTTAVPTDGHRLFFRTFGIDDNTGQWFPVGYEGDLSGVLGDFIQFKIEFRTIGLPSVGSRIYGLSLLYESEDPIPSVYMWNFGDSVINQGIFGFAQIALWNTAIPVHRIQIIRSDTGALVLDEISSSNTSGVFENWNGSSWVSGLGSDAVNKRLRFRPTASLPANLSLYAKITT